MKYKYARNIFFRVHLTKCSHHRSGLTSTVAEGFPPRPAAAGFSSRPETNASTTTRTGDEHSAGYTSLIDVI